MSVEHLKQKALQALHEGRINLREYDLYMISLEGQDKKNSDTFIKSIAPKAEPAPMQKELFEKEKELFEKLFEKTASTTPKPIEKIKKSYAKPIVALLIFILVANITWIAYNTNNISGHAVFETPQQNYSNNMTIHSPQQLTSIRITGTMYGEGMAAISYNTTNGLLRVATINSDPGKPRTSKPSYNAGEGITLDHEPASYTAYLDDGTNNIAVTLPLQAPQNNATLLLLVNDSNNITTYRLPIIIGNYERKTAFENLCDETCQMAPATGDLIIQTTSDAKIIFNKVDTTTAQNSAPTYAIPINPLTINQTTTIDLNMHFADAQSDTIYYSTSNAKTANLSINNSIVTITPISNGQETITIYASDLKEITTETFELTVKGIADTQINIAPNTTNETNNVANTTINKTTTNETYNANNNTENSTLSNNTNNTATNTALDCSNPNPNARPIDCLNINAQKLLAESIYWENVDRTKVARFTPVGNLLISGKIIQNSNESPHNNDFKILYSNSDYQTLATIWVDGATGDLHLRGMLYEEQGNMLPPQGSYTVMNIRGIYLAYADSTTGNLYLRGNLIPYRTNILE